MPAKHDPDSDRPERRECRSLCFQDRERLSALAMASGIDDPCCW